MPDLSTTYLGLPLQHPIVASAGPISQSLDGIRRLEDGGAAAIVMYSLFEEQIRRENDALGRLLAAGSDLSGEASSYFPTMEDFVAGPDAYLALVRQAREAVKVPIIASLNGSTPDGWVDYARQLHEAGAHAIELNLFHIPADTTASGRAVEQQYEDVVRRVCAAVPIPVAVKLSPYFSAMGEMARRLVEAGAKGLVLFNRFYQPDFDIDRMDVAPTLELSSPSEIRLPLLWIAVLRGRIRASLAATTGVHSHVEAAKYILAGADVAMSTSAVLKHGPSALGIIRDDLARWMDRKGFDSLAQIRGSMSQERVASPSAFERANYIKILQGWRD
ncbi:dihydroorotate dehydrogenase [Luteitalea sp. TBR-22]|uniref:dihydroorotate dehydrogenase-like protein n=1 Tax=Luteitalea sp. TBR-22 TaxID=2802971 RepID=UPI001AFA86AD|nr:dihydroorotate dehydrogenase-like protein [Luteitalea sp. TBR-22]BCS32021.1 dihydroorotate dehydrogenase [Luteitalea sp. TBR-22]